MATYIDDLIYNYSVQDPLNKIAYEVTNYIKNAQDYTSAINMILENNLKLEDIVSRTVRLKFDEVVELADKLISLKK